MTAEYWTTFAKRKNSTKQPSATGTSLTVNLKEGTSIEKPIFLISGDVFNISYIKAFGDHYYFIDDIKSVRNGLTEVSCSMDPMATFKTEIGSYSALVERSAYSYDADYPDPAVSVQNSIVSDHATDTVSHLDSTGYFALTVNNNTGSGTGFMVTYFVTPAQLKQIAQYVNTDWGSAATDVVSWLQATFLKTADNIVDCRWMPIDVTAFSSDSVQVNMTVGVDTLNITAYELAYPTVAINSGSISIPHYYSDFRRYAPYTMAKLYIPCYGMVDINTLDFAVSNTIYWVYYIDPQTGDAFVGLAADSSFNVVISTYTFNISVQCPVGRVATDIQGFMTSGLTTSAMVAGAMALPSKFSTAAGIATGASAINTISSMLGVTSSVHGTQSGRCMSLNLNFGLCLEAKVTQDPSTLTAEAGRPCMATHTISTIPGYIKCVNASIEIAGMEQERETINNYMNTGFYYE